MPSGCFVSTVSPVWFFVVMDRSTVCFQAASSTTPTPPVDGQISLLTSFTCQSWWLLPSLDPLATTRSRHFSVLSRQYAQPLIVPTRNFTVCCWYAGSFNFSVFAHTASCSIDVPAAFQSMIWQSSGVDSLA